MASLEQLLGGDQFGQSPASGGNALEELLGGAPRPKLAKWPQDVRSSLDALLGSGEENVPPGLGRAALAALDADFAAAPRSAQRRRRRCSPAPR